MLVQLRGVAALHARAQSRMLQRTDTPGSTSDDTAEELPLLRRVTGPMLLHLMHYPQCILHSNLPLS